MLRSRPPPPWCRRPPGAPAAAVPHRAAQGAALHVPPSAGFPAPSRPPACMHFLALPTCLSGPALQLLFHPTDRRWILFFHLGGRPSRRPEALSAGRRRPLRMACGRSPPYPPGAPRAIDSCCPSHLLPDRHARVRGAVGGRRRQPHPHRRAFCGRRAQPPMLRVGAQAATVPVPRPPAAGPFAWVHHIFPDNNTSCGWLRSAGRCPKRPDCGACEGFPTCAPLLPCPVLFFLLVAQTT